MNLIEKRSSEDHIIIKLPQQHLIVCPHKDIYKKLYKRMKHCYCKVVEN